MLTRSFRDFEIVVIDDYSAEDTPAVVASIADARIRYFRNETNVCSRHGHGAHVRRFLNELTRGKHFVYLCDDDYWLPLSLLECPLALFRDNPGLAFVFGNQFSYDLGGVLLETIGWFHDHIHAGQLGQYLTSTRVSAKPRTLIISRSSAPRPL